MGTTEGNILTHGNGRNQVKGSQGRSSGEHSAGGPDSTHSHSDDASLALEQPVSASDSSSISSMQQMAYLTKADFSATILQFLEQLMALLQPSLSRA